GPGGGGRLLERSIRVRGEDFRPLVAVVTGGVATGEDVREAVLEAVPGWHGKEGDLLADRIEHRLDTVVIPDFTCVQLHVEQRELDLAESAHAGLEVLRREHPLEE